MARTTQRPGLPLWLPIAVIVAGLVGGAVPGVQIVTRLVRSAIDTFDAPTIATPTEVGMDLDADRYLVFERTGTTKGVGGGGVEVRTTRNDAPQLSPELVQVVAIDDGTRLEVARCSCSETITKGERIYTATLVFEVDDAGRHGLRITGPPSEVIVTKSITDAFDGIGRWVAVAVLAALVIAVGVALLVVSLVGRRRTG